MKKIIGAFDAYKFSNSTKEYAMFFARELSAHLTAIIFEDPERFIAKEKKLTKQAQKDNLTLISSFEDTCIKNEILYNIQRDNHLAISELLRESIYADMLILAINETFYYRLEKTPIHFIGHLFAEVQCPVLLVPEEYKPIDKVVLLYDGEPLSVHAIKMYSNMFKQFGQLQPEVITVRNDFDNLNTLNNRLIKDFIKRHYPEATYTVLKGDAGDAITNYLKKQSKNALVVLGAHQKDTVTSLFKEGMVDRLMREVKMPLYIVHSK